jgi:ABC-type sugar transport system ATPase subunit
MDEPTRGVDIASKVDIYNLMNDLIRKKSAIILISSSFDELVGMCDRILVLKDGKISFEAHKNKANEFDTLYRHAIGQAK